MPDIRGRIEILTPHGDDQGQKNQKSTVNRTECEKCGSCCSTSSPMIFREDMPLFLSNILDDKNTYTIRAGEPLFNREEQELYFAPFEMIKIQEDAGCVLHERSGQCSIYGQRPSQCKAYRCWNTEPPLEGIEDKRITRHDLFGQIKPLYEIIERHEQVCSYTKMVELIESLEQGTEEEADQIIEMLKFDATVREFVTERFQIDPRALDLMFGRPMADSLEFFGLELVRQGDAIVLKAKDTCHERGFGGEIS